MRHLKSILILLTFLSFNSLYAHKDRIERPISYVFYFGKEMVEIKSSENAKLNSYNELINSKKKKLTHALLIYETGETISFKFIDFKCTQIQISYMKRTRSIPEKKVKKIPGINLLKVDLLWSGDKPQAFDSEYFYIEFAIGKTTLPYLQFFFNQHKFTNSVIWSKAEDNASQWKKF